jgi:hypothetical protein
MKRLLIILLLTIFTGSFTATFAQSPAIHKSIASKRMDEAKKAKNPNIRTAKPTTDTEVKKETVRGGCDVTFSNKTGYFVDVYLDGNFKCTIGPWESADVSNSSGYSTVYCMTIGGKYDWTMAGDCSFHYYYELN